MGNPGEKIDMSEEIIAVGSGNRRLEDVALDLMKFVAMTAGIGKAGMPAGFQSRTDKNEDVVESLLELYERCRGVVEKKAK